MTDHNVLLACNCNHIDAGALFFFFFPYPFPFIYLNHVFRSILEREEIRSIHWTATAVSLSLSPHTPFFIFFLFCVCLDHSLYLFV